MESELIKTPVRNHVFSTYAPFKNWGGPFSLNQEKERTLNNQQEYQIFGFNWGEKRVYNDRENPEIITIVMKNLTEKERTERRINDVNYHVSPRCGKAEYEDWTYGNRWIYTILKTKHI